MSEPSFELECAVSPAIGKLIAGVLLTAMGAVVASGNGVAGGVLLVIGVPLLVNGGRIVLLRPPRLRATASGLWFGGGRGSSLAAQHEAMRAGAHRVVS